MMNKPPNIYSQVVYDLHGKVADYLDQLNQSGQIDLDDDGYPYVIGVEKQGPNQFVKIIRNNKLEHFLLNPRKKRDPIKSWNDGDGYVRSSGKKVVFADPEGQKGERAKRLSMESFERLVEQMVEE